MEDSLHELVEDARSGSIPAINELLERNLPGLRAFIRLRCGPVVRDRESASDLAQSVCREVLEHIDRFQYGGEAGFRHWLYATALRTIQNRHVFWKRKKRDAEREVRIAGGAAQGDAAFSGALQAGLELAYRSLSSPSNQAIAREDLARIEFAFDVLSEGDREIITLARLVGLPHKEIAELTGKTEGATRVQLNRALARLATLLDDGVEP